MWNVSAFYETLPMMAKGMGGIFIVTAAIILSIVLLNGLCRKKPDRAERNK